MNIHNTVNTICTILSIRQDCTLSQGWTATEMSALMVDGNSDECVDGCGVGNECVDGYGAGNECVDG